MRRAALALVLMAVLASPQLTAQSSQCTAQAVASRDACQKGTDLFLMLAPQLSGALAGGGAMIGTARMANGLSLGLRLNVVEGQVPELGAVSISSTGAVQSTIETKRTPVPMPTFDAAFSLIPGFNAGRQRILAVDLLASVAYVPTSDLEAFSVRTTNGAFKIGYGARVGLLADAGALPAVSVSYLRRTLPTSDIAASLPINGLSGSAGRDSIALGALSLRADALRASISKRIGFVEIGGGAGQDRYRNFAQLRTQVTPVILGAPLPPVRSLYVVTQTLTRNAVYGSLALNFGRVHLGAELGQTFGGDSVTTFNTFTDGKVNAARRFGTAGLRVRF